MRALSPHEIEQRRRFGTLLKSRRRLAGLSLTALAERAGLSFDRTRNAESGRTTLRAAEIGALVRALPALGEVLSKPRRWPGTSPAPTSTATPSHSLPLPVASSVSELAELASVREVAAVLSASEYAVRELVRTQKLEARRLGRLLRVTRASVQRFVHGEAPAPEAAARYPRTASAEEATRS
jgi:excisionase family DNA binding protein